MSELIPIFVDILLPVFTLVGVGLAAGRRMKLDAAPLSKIAYYVLAPAFFFDLLRDADIETAVVGQMAAAMVITTVSAGGKYDEWTVIAFYPKALTGG